MTQMRILAAALMMAAAVGPVRAEEIALPDGTYRATVLRVIDGDTVEARVRSWLDTDVTVLVRLRGIDAPEFTGASCPAERRAAEAARTDLADLIGVGPIHLTGVGPDPFAGRAVPWGTAANWCGEEGE